MILSEGQSHALGYHLANDQRNTKLCLSKSWCCWIVGHKFLTVAQSQSGERILSILSFPPSRQSTPQPLHPTPQINHIIQYNKKIRHQEKIKATIFWYIKLVYIHYVSELCWKNRCIAKFPHHVIETLPRYRRVIIIRSYISPHFSPNWVIKIISGKITLILKSNHFHQKIIPIYESFCKTLSELIFFLPLSLCDYIEVSGPPTAALLASFTWICWN